MLLRRVALAALVSAALPVGIAAAAGAGQERAAYRFEVVLRGLREPVHVAIPTSQPNNLYVVERRGRIRVRVGGRLRARPFLDLRGKVALDVEQGRLSMAFHPRYASNRLFYVYYTDLRGAIRIVEYKARGFAALPATARQVAAVSHPGSNHNGGQLAFGPDRLLYFGIGDGGGEGDPNNFAQRLTNPYGKLFRINVNRRKARAQMVGFGLRNPWRFSFDRRTGDLYIGDVGQNLWEEIDFTPRESPGLENYGWRVYEGESRYKNEDPNPSGTLIFPVHAYGRAGGASVTGGFVYRGRAVPQAYGRYFFGDFASGRVWTLVVQEGVVTEFQREPFSIGGLASFAEGPRGELYAVSYFGAIYRLVR
ncbi:MAG: PQQ-dependent sugar dehydrogenase [Gaiellaceae bacterium]